MKKPIPKRFLILVRIFIAILLGILVYLAMLLAAQYRYIAREQEAHGKRMQFSNFRRHHTLSIQDLSLIESWMTFDYISTVFRVPVAIIKTRLNIDDPRFPRTTLHRYAKMHGFADADFVSKVADVVGQYLMSTSTPPNIQK